MKFVRRALYIMVPLVLLVLIFVTLVLWAPAVARPVVTPVRAWLLRTVSSQVSNALNGSLSLGSLEGSLLSAPTIRDVVLKDAQGEVVAQLRELRLRYSLSPLLKKKLLVSDITIAQPYVKVVQQANGSLNLSDLAPPSEPQPPKASSGFSLPIDIELQALSIDQGRADLQLLALPGVKNVDGLNLRARGALSKTSYDLELQQLTANTRPAEVNLNTLRGALQLIGSAIHIKDFQLQTDASRIAVNGTLPGRKQPADLTVKIEPFDMADVGRLLADPTLSGLVQANIGAEGPPEALNIVGKISAAGGEVTLDGKLNLAADAMGLSGQSGDRQARCRRADSPGRLQEQSQYALSGARQRPRAIGLASRGGNSHSALDLWRHCAQPVGHSCDGAGQALRDPPLASRYVRGPDARHGSTGSGWGLGP